MSDPDRTFRSPTHDERRVLAAFFHVLSDRFQLDAASDAIEVADMLDGGMGSVTLRIDGVVRSAHHLAAEFEYADADGTPILVSLFVDPSGMPGELDFWRIDNAPRMTKPAEIPPITLIPRG